MIRLEQVSKSFASQAVVADLSFELEAVGVTGFLGPNGAGKTTTMRLIAGFLMPDSGRISLPGVILLIWITKKKSVICRKIAHSTPTSRCLSI